MDNIISYWYIIVGIVCVVGIAGYKLATTSKAKKLEVIREWLLYAVIEAEKELGAKTGQVKLRFAYDLFIQRFFKLAKVIPFETFSCLVDEALREMRHLIETNESVNKLVSEGDETNGNS